jgi:DNA-directed RNA polymerase subunit RPC12/RpoP
MAEFKFFCPQCGQRIQCDTSYSGRQINCPVCQQAIVVPRADGATPVPVKPQALRKVLVIAAWVAAFAGLIIVGWFGYSKIRIYVKSGHLPSGVVALWSGEGNGKDSIGGNNAVLTDISFAKGKVGQAFRFNGESSSIKITASPSLDVGAGDGFTITAWIKLSDVNKLHPILGWNNGGGNASQLGVEFYISEDAGPGSLYANVEDSNSQWHPIHSRVNPIKTDGFQYVALTYDKTSSLAEIYCNGTVVAKQKLGSFTPQTTYNFYLGSRPSDEGLIFAGLMDEIAIYSRALSASEIHAIYEKQK